MARNVLKYEKLLAESPSQAAAEAVIQRPNVPHLQTRATYEELCQTLGSQVGLFRESKGELAWLERVEVGQCEEEAIKMQGPHSESPTFRFFYAIVPLN